MGFGTAEKKGSAGRWGRLRADRLLCDHWTTPTKSVVHTGSDDVVGESNIARTVEAGTVDEQRRGKGSRIELCPEIGVKIFELDGPIISKRVFGSCTCRPAGDDPGLAPAPRRNRITEQNALVGEGGAAGAINQQPVLGVTNSTSQRVEPGLAGLKHLRGNERRNEVGAALGVGP